MKTLLITSDFPPGFGGGISRHYHSLCRESHGEIGVLAPLTGEVRAFDRSQSFPVFRARVPLARSLPSRLSQSLLLGICGGLIARRKGARSILFGHWYLSAAGPLIQRLFGIPFGVFLHGGELDQVSGKRLTAATALRAIHAAGVVIVNSEHTRQEFLRHSGGHLRIAKVNPGVDTERFNPRVDGHLVLQRHGLDGRRVLLTVARLVERKGHDTVIRALPRILDAFPDTAYLIVGSGPTETKLRTLAREIGVANEVVFAGEIPDDELPAYYGTCDLFVMPSRQIAEREGVEGFGIVYLEANACGKPVIGGRSGGVGEAIEDGVTGLLVDPLDGEAFAAAAVRILADRDLTRALGIQGRRRAEQEFDWGVQADRLLGLVNAM